MILLFQPEIRQTLLDGHRAQGFSMMRMSAELFRLLEICGTNGDSGTESGGQTGLGHLESSIFSNSRVWGTHWGR